MPHLFEDDTEAYTEAAKELNTRIRRALENIFDEAEGAGFPMRETAHLIGETAGVISSERVIRRAVKKRKDTERIHQLKR